MRIPMLSGRDFRDSDSSPSVAIVNETFAKTYFNGANPVGSSFVTKRPDGVDVHYEIVGLVHDAIYRELREVMLPQAYIPIHRAVVTSNVSTTLTNGDSDPASCGCITAHGQCDDRSTNFKR